MSLFHLCIMNPFRLAEQFNRGTSGSIPAVYAGSVILASATRLSRPANKGTGVGPKENGDLIRPTKILKGHKYTPSSMPLRELRPEEVVQDLNLMTHTLAAALTVLTDSFDIFGSS